MSHASDVAKTLEKLTADAIEDQRRVVERHAVNHAEAAVLDWPEFRDAAVAHWMASPWADFAPIYNADYEIAAIAFAREAQKDGYETTRVNGFSRGVVLHKPRV